MQGIEMKPKMLSAQLPPRLVNAVRLLEAENREE
jgi:hypothetical protein